MCFFFPFFGGITDVADLFLAHFWSTSMVFFEKNTLTANFCMCHSQSSTWEVRCRISHDFTEFTTVKSHMACQVSYLGRVQSLFGSSSLELPSYPQVLVLGDPFELRSQCCRCRCRQVNMEEVMLLPEATGIYGNSTSQMAPQKFWLAKGRG